MIEQPEIRKHSPFGQNFRHLLYLLDPDSGEREEYLTLAYLAHQYLGETYPHGAVMIYEQASQAFPEILARDAELIWRLSQVLFDVMPSDLKKLYRHVELPLMIVLDQMRRDGIGVDREACAIERDRVQEELQTLSLEITGGEGLNLNSDREVFRFLAEPRGSSYKYT